MVRVLAFLTFFALLGGVASATTCDMQKALLYLSLANNFINADPPTRQNATKATRFASLAVDMNGACIKASLNPNEIGNLYLSTGQNLAIAAVAQDRLGNHVGAERFANLAVKVWREIVAEPVYPAKARASARRQLDAFSR
jgi:hypothetical protein